MDVFKLLGTIVISNSDANEALKETGEEGKKTESKLGKAFKSIGNGALAVGKTIGAGLLAGGAAMGALTAKAVNLAGELEQNMGGSEAVFKEYAGEMQKTAKEAFSNMGLSTSDFLATANKMGALFQGAGFGIEESADLSAKAMQRAADVASIMGLDTSSAMEAVAGAAKGNFTMMDNLGVAMNETALEAYALEKGMSKAYSEMSQQEKIGVAMEMFLDKTAYAAGNYAKENETLAGSLGTAKAALTNFLDGSGDVDSLVTAFSNAADVIVKNVGDVAPRLVSGLSEIIQKVIPMVPPLLQDLLPVIIDGATSLIGGLISALPSVLDLLINTALPQLLEGVVTIADALISALPQLISLIASALPSLVTLLIDALVELILVVCTNLPLIIQPIIDNLPMILESLLSGLLSALPVLVQGLIGLVVALIPMIPQILNILLDFLTGTYATQMATKLLEMLPALLVGIGQIIVALCKALPGMLLALGKLLFASFIQWYNILTTVFEPVVSWFGDLFKKAWSGIKKAWSGVKGYFGDLWSGIKKTFSISTVTSFFKNAFNSAWKAVRGVFSGVKNYFLGLWGDIKSAFSEIGTKIADSISGAVKKGINGVIGSAERIINGFFGMVNGAIDMINKIPKVNISKIKMVEFARLAKGGVVNEPTPAIFGEDGAEAVVPLENNQGWLKKVARHLHEFSIQYKGGLDDSFSIRTVELQQAQVSEMQTLNITASKILKAILALDENMGGNLREALEGVSLGVNKREFARLVKGVS